MLETYSINSIDCKEDETKRKKEETVFSDHLLSLLLNTIRCHLNFCHKMTFYLFHDIAERQWQVLYKYRKIVWKKKSRVTSILYEFAFYSRNTLQISLVKSSKCLLFCSYNKRWIDEREYQIIIKCFHCKGPFIFVHFSSQSKCDSLQKLCMKKILWQQWWWSLDSRFKKGEIGFLGMNATLIF